ncbi:MAG TPA: glycosyltransferase [Pseudomonas sp.]|uniref:glycosyltransferase n=1 Tax=Pseudomonas sp. TaxID=306 RepID=UPI002B6FF3C3|nr:glycosyltransferase [Pseudomonas sp.]HWH88330.1 glycosyltransferase [Pseudomonas sp.]
MSVKLPKVAVLLAAYNGTRWIEEQMASILGQSEVDVTVYISVDPSSDGTEVWCSTLAASESNVVLLPSAGKFGGASRNFFRLIRDVEIDHFEYVAFADQDDIWYADKLLRAVSGIEQQKADAYSSNVIAFWPNGRKRLLDKAQAQVEWDYLFEAAGPGCTYVMNKRLFSAIKASVLSNWDVLQLVSLHDWFFYAYARSHGFKWFIDAVPSMAYRQHEHNQVGANTGFKSILSRYKTINNGWWFGQVKLIAHLVGVDSAPFVVSWFSLSRWQLLKLSFNAWRCRRRTRDKILFLLICLITIFVGRKEVALFQ